MKKRFIKLLTLLILSLPLVGCSGSRSQVKVTASSNGTEKIDKIDGYIELGDTIDLKGVTTGISVSDNIITIQCGGTYCISGTLNEGQIVVDAKDSNVNLVLNGVDITCSNSSPVLVKEADKTVIALADGSENVLNDGENYIYEDENTDKPDSAIYSKDYITFIGSSGSLTVNGNYNDGIKGKDDLVIEGGNITVNSVNDGITGKDSLLVTDGNITVDAGKDGLKSSNETDEGKGNIKIDGGNINIVSDGDGIQGINNVEVNDGEINIVTNGGSENAPEKKEAPPGGEMMDGGPRPSNENQNEMPENNQPEPPEGFSDEKREALNDQMRKEQGPPDMENQDIYQGEMPGNEQDDSKSEDTEISNSAKAIKSDVNLVINGGNITIDSYDDGIHSNDAVIVNGGTINIASGDDGIHADNTLDINEGNIEVSKSYEGIESQVININGGNIYVTSSDDGINASGGSEESSKEGPGENNSDDSVSSMININGGYIYVNASGDGLDANGSIYMKDGFVIVNGPTDNGNGALDYDNEFNISGGTLISAGSSGMLQATSESSSQNTLKIVMNSLEGGNIIRIESEDGKELLTFAPSKKFSSLVVSSPEINTGTTYKVYIGGTCTGEIKDGVYEDGDYENGTEIGSGIVESSITSINEEGVSLNTMRGPGGMRDRGKDFN
ncbi:carbohydrate-binding domain-containing protein [uncultured Clostridium sp.]|uniref:carbohydrate-binding domain-containing protein n=1 Tax=uncultured Clostridium sp. TaxID=59620 RepID=UPI0025D4C6AD|nr:carbohydrate-binding domain-containing protein [uncultured Clostridium sp.]